MTPRQWMLCLAVACVSAPAFAQPTIPRTPDGHPDFQGGWATIGINSMERMPGATALAVDDAEARRLADAFRAQARSPAFELTIDPAVLDADVKTLMRVNGQWRTSMLIEPADGKLPLSAEGQKAVADERMRILAPGSAGPEARPNFERCLAGSGTAPLWLLPIENHRQIVQTTGSMVIYTEEGGDTRIIGIGANHRPAVLTAFGGDSVARWEGDDLVVETTGVRDWHGPFRSNPQVVRQQSKVIERFRLVARDEIDYSYTIEDPAMYSRPWTAEFSLIRDTRDRIFEYGCHEGNYSLPNILRAARIADNRVTAPSLKPVTPRPKP